MEKIVLIATTTFGLETQKIAKKLKLYNDITRKRVILQHEITLF